MPLHDHFRPPVENELPWETLHSSWATRIADVLNESWLSDQFVALEHTHVGPRVEIDVLTVDRGAAEAAPASKGNGGVATLSKVWAPPEALLAVPAVFPDRFEVRLVSTARGRPVVAAIELISPGNKKDAESRNAFVAKCASYLHEGVSLAIIDVVTERHANLHNELARFLNLPPRGHLPAEDRLYAASYRPVIRDEKPLFEIWATPCEVGSELPTMPLRLTGDVFVPVEFELTYVQTCRKRKLLI
jgi:hypothetical protein